MRISRFRPPMPFAQAPSGICRFCGESTDSKRRNWHPECIPQWQVATTVSMARQAAFDKCGGKCEACGREHKVNDTRGWQHDHIVPLWKAPRELQYWLVGNLQVLCAAPCHQRKTAREARERADARKGPEMQEVMELA